MVETIMGNSFWDEKKPTPVRVQAWGDLRDAKAVGPIEVASLRRLSVFCPHRRRETRLGFIGEMKNDRTPFDQAKKKPNR